MPGPPLVVKRWKRFGHDRLYVAGSGGEQIGWSDLKTGRLHAASPGNLPLLSQAVADWNAESSGEPPPTPPFTDASSPAVPSPAVRGLAASQAEVEARSAAAPPAGRYADLYPPPFPLRPLADLSPPIPVAPGTWTDLAANGPGVSARAKAVSLRDAAPVRTFFARLVNLRTPERAWRIGADGEEMVAAELTRLCQYDPRWRVLHAIGVGARGSDIDHLVVGPGGIFTLNTKHHPGAAIWVGGDTFMVNGRRQPYLRNSRHEAGRAARLLTSASGIPVNVTGVVVPVRARSVTIKSAPLDLAVVPRKQITSWLLDRGPVLDHRALGIISEVARRSATWQPAER